MIDCERCSKPIGNLEEPIFVTEDDGIVCRDCLPPGDPGAASPEFDRDEVTLVPLT